MPSEQQREEARRGDRAAIPGLSGSRRSSGRCSSEDTSCCGGSPNGKLTRRGLTVEQLAEALDAATTATEPPTPAPTVTDSTD